MGGKEEVVEVAEHGHDKVPGDVQEGVVGEDHAPLPDLVLPLHFRDATQQKEFVID